MNSAREDLRKVLQHLAEREFKSFKWFLKEDDISGCFSAIPEANLDGADREDTVDLMVRKYHCDGALQRTVHILGKINRNDLSKRLSGLQNIDCDPRKAQSEETAAQLHRMMEERRKKILEIQQSAELSRKSAERQTNDSKRVFKLLLQFFKTTQQNHIKELKSKQKTTQEEAEKLIRELEQEVAHIKQLLSDKHLGVIQQPSDKNWTEVHVSQPSYGTIVMTTVSTIKTRLEEEMDAFLAKAKLTRVQQFEEDVTLDPDSAHPTLNLSQDGKEVFCSDVKRDVPDNPKRFNATSNVLARQSFSSGKFYYEVQVDGKTSWDVGVVKESINRKGSITAKPDNGFWTICLRMGDKYKAHDTHLRTKNPPKRVGVFVEYDKRLVSFFNADSGEVIHRFSDCSFEGRLYPFFSPGNDHSDSTPLIIRSVKHNEQLHNELAES